MLSSFINCIISKSGLIFGSICICFLGYVKYLHYDIKNLEKEIIIKDQSILTLESAINRQNEEIEKLKVDNSNVLDQFRDISNKYNDIKLNKENIEQYSKDNNISINESKLIIERNRIQRGLDAFFNR